MFSILSFSGIELSNQELIRFGAWFEKLLFMRQDAAGPRPRLTGVLETVKSLQTVKSLGVHWRNKAEEGNLIYFNFSQLKLSLQLSQMFFAKKLSKLFTTLSSFVHNSFGSLKARHKSHEHQAGHVGRWRFGIRQLPAVFKLNRESVPVHKQLLQTIFHEIFLQHQKYCATQKKRN